MFHCSHYLFLSDAPEFISGKDAINISVISGNSVTLNCGAMANPSLINLNLTYNIANNTANNIATTSTSFVITSATSGNQGYYTCSATNIVAIKQLVYNLIVGGNNNNTTHPFKCIHSSIIHISMYPFISIYSSITNLCIHYSSPQFAIISTIN